MGHYVTAPLVITRHENGTDLYLYQGAPVPSHVKADELKRLSSEGLIASNEEPAAEKSNGAPAKAAPKDEWVAFAKSQGDEQAEGKTKEQLIADHGDN